MTKRQADRLADDLAERGFSGAHASKPTRGDALSWYVHVTCDQCAALVINGTATHERGCPNQRHECRGCSATVAREGDYCADCQ